MSNTDFEELLRESLHARAAEVTPNPETWDRVQDRIRKRQQLRWALAGVTAAAALVLAAVTLPGLLNPARVDLAPADRAPEGADILSNVELGGYLVHLEGETRIVGLDFEPLAGGGSGSEAPFAVWPGSTTEAFTYVTTGDCELTVVVGDAGAVSASSGDVDSCPIGAPQYSSDGTFLFWLERPGDQWVLRAMTTSDGRPVSDVEAGLTIAGADDLADVRLHDVALDRTTGGFVVRIAGTDDGTRSLYRTTIDRPGSAEASSGPGDVQREDEADGHRPVSVATTNSADGTRRTYQLAVATDDAGAITSTRLVALEGGGRTDLALDNLELSEPAALWTTALGDVALFGDGQRVFTARYDNGAWTDPEVLHDELAYAVPVAAAGDAAPRPAAVKLPERLAASDGERLWVSGTDYCAEGACDGGEVLRFAVRPTDAASEVVAVQRAVGCGSVELARAGSGQRFEPLSPGADCATSPVWSPDGRHLAWLSTDDNGSTPITIVVRGFDADGQPEPGRAASNAAFTLELPSELSGAQLTDWVWTEGDGDVRRGLLMLSVFNSHGQVGTATVEVERQGDGAIAVAADTPVVELGDEQGYTPLVRVSADRGGSALERADGVGAPMIQLARTGDGVELGRFDGPDLASTTVDLDAEQHDLWLTALGDRVAFGERGGRAYSAIFTPDGSFAVEALPAGIVHAAWQPFAAPVSEATAEPEATEPVDSAADSPAEPNGPAPTTEPTEPTEPPQPVTDEPPAAVMATHERIRLAAGNGDIDGLVALMPSDFTSSYGRGPGPDEGRAELEDMEQRGEEPYSILLQLLLTEPAEAGGIWVWPAEHVTADEHLGYRVGIRADGTWQYFVAGD